MGGLIPPGIDRWGLERCSLADRRSRSLDLLQQDHDKLPPRRRQRAHCWTQHGRSIRQSVQNGQFLSSLVPALPSHFPGGTASVPGPQPLPSVRLGFPGLAGHGDVMSIKAVATPQAREAARRVSAAKADARAASLAPVIAEIRASGITTPYAIAAALTARGIPTARGHRFWMAGPVRNLLDRLDRLAASGAVDGNPKVRERKTSAVHGVYE